MVTFTADAIKPVLTPGESEDSDYESQDTEESTSEQTPDDNEPEIEWDKIEAQF